MCQGQKSAGDTWICINACCLNVYHEKVPENILNFNVNPEIAQDNGLDTQQIDIYRDLILRHLIQDISTTCAKLGLPNGTLLIHNTSFIFLVSRFLPVVIRAWSTMDQRDVHAIQSSAAQKLFNHWY